jgi:hypothetical protein
MVQALARGEHECNGRKCMDCGFHCYTHHDASAGPVYVAEALRKPKGVTAQAFPAVIAKVRSDLAIQNRKCAHALQNLGNVPHVFLQFGNFVENLPFVRVRECAVCYEVNRKFCGMLFRMIGSKGHIRRAHSLKGGQDFLCPGVRVYLVIAMGASAGS